MANLTLAIMATPARTEWAESVRDALDRPTEIIYDPNPVPSTDPRQRWNTACLTYEHLAGSTSDWVGFIQDDALVARDLYATTEKILDAFPQAQGLLSLYAGTGRPDQANVRRAIRHAELNDECMWSTRSLNWGVGVVFPREHATKIIQFGNNSVFRRSPLDYITGVYFRDRIRWRTWYLHPSLVDHRDVDSLVGHDKPGQARKAHQFIGTDASGLDIDWTRRPVSGVGKDGALLPGLPK